MKGMSELRVRQYRPEDEDQVVDLWMRCGLVRPVNDPRRDILAKMSWQPELFLVGTTEERIVGTVMVGYDGHRGWINYLGVSPDLRRQGIGRTMMKEAERRLSPKINLQVRTSNSSVIEFYARIGYKVDDVVSMGLRL
jgi:ribosomal protein S18 acetylase RimI-like enzyme